MAATTRIGILALLGGLLGTLCASPARADGVFTPYIGRVFGGATAEKSTVYGASIAGVGGSGLGFEADLGYSPDFFRVGDEGDGNMTTLMGNIVFSAPLHGAGIRPYVSGGVGLMRFRLPDVGEFFDISRNDFAVNAGAGLMVFASDSFGIRGDLRYFRSLENDADDAFPGLDLGSFDFWRGTVGVSFKW